MNENEKRRFDAIWELCKDSWQRISERRIYEWRANFSVWTMFAAFVVIVLTKTLSVQQTYLRLGVGIAGLILSLIHLWWLKKLNDATTTDRAIARHYVSILQTLSNSGFDKDLEAKLARGHITQASIWQNQARLSGWYVTMALYITTILVVCR